MNTTKELTKKAKKKHRRSLKQSFREAAAHKLHQAGVVIVPARNGKERVRLSKDGASACVQVWIEVPASAAALMGSMVRS